MEKTKFQELILFPFSKRTHAMYNTYNLYTCVYRDKDKVKLIIKKKLIKHWPIIKKNNIS